MSSPNAGLPHNLPAASAAEDVFPLSARVQRVNSLIFIVNTSLSFLVAPVFYVGVLHAAICSSLGASNAVANLPSAIYLWVTPLPVLIAWLWSSPRFLKPLLVASYLLRGLAGAGLAVLVLLAPASWVIPALAVHAAIVGITNGMTNMCLWELLGRGISLKGRSWTLAWAFGLGPILAVVGSAASQLVLSGNFLDAIRISPPHAPLSYALLFGVTAPAMLLSAALAAFARPAPAADSHAARAASGGGVWQGVREYFTHPLILVAAGAFLLTYAGGNAVLSNLALYVRDAMGQDPEAQAGLQLVLRFGCKCVGGFLLGWLAVRTNPKLPALATSVISLAGVAWALALPGEWYLLSFGLLGVGELFYVYYLNYIVSCSAPHRVRENTAYTNLITVCVGFMPVIYGELSDSYGLRASFFLAGGILAAACLLAGMFLPRQPAPRMADAAAADAPPPSNPASD